MRFFNTYRKDSMPGRKRKDFRDYSISDRPQTSRDCTVRALVIASGIDYDIAYLAIALTGRRNNSGARLSQWVRAYRKFGQCLPENQIKRGDPIPTDNVICLVYGHVFSIRNGVHSDGAYAAKRNRIKLAWRIP